MKQTVVMEVGAKTFDRNCREDARSMAMYRCTPPGPCTDRCKTTMCGACSWRLISYVLRAVTTAL